MESIKIKEKFAVSYYAKMLTYVVQIISGILIARFAGAYILGIFSFGLAFTSMFIFISDFGLGTVHVKILSEGNNIGNCIRTFSVLKILLSLLYAAVTLILIIVPVVFFGRTFESEAHFWVLFILLACMFVQQFIIISEISYAGLIQQYRQHVPSIIFTIISQALKLIVVVIGLGAIAMSIGTFAAAVFAAGIALRYFRQLPRGNYDHQLALKYAKTALPVILVAVSSSIVANIDKVMIQYYSNASDLGLYAIAFRLSMMVWLIGESMGSIFFPLFSRYFSKGQGERVDVTIEKYEKAIVYILSPAIFLSLAYSNEIVHFLLGDEFIKASIIIKVLVVASIVKILNMPYSHILTGSGKFFMLGIIGLIEVFLLLIFFYFFVNSNQLNYGVVGGAVAVLMANVVTGVILRFKAIDVCRHIRLKRNFVYIASMALIVIALFGLRLYIHQSSLLAECLFACLFLTTSYMILFRANLLQKQDIRRLVHVLNIHKWIGKLKKL